MRLPFSVNHYLCPPSLGLSGFLDLVEAAGFDSVGLTQRALDERPLAELRREVESRGLGVSSVNSAGFLLGEPPTRQNERNLRLVEAAAELDARVLNVLPGHADGLSNEGALAVVSDGFESLAAVAERAGIRLALEPLHARSARIRSCINTITVASRLIGRSAAACLTLDMYHLWHDPDLAGAIDGTCATPGLVQICDIGDPDDRARRAPLDEGTVDWRSLVASVQRLQPGVPIELELFADQLPGRAAAELIRSAAKLLGTLQTAGAP